MKTRLINSNFTDNYSKNLFQERGIKDVENFLNPKVENVQSYEILTNIFLGASLIKNTLNGPYALVVDCDVDGFTSASIIYKYLKKLNPNLIIDYYIHEGKQHGLEDQWEKISNKDYALVIVPDAGSNDSKFAEELSCPVLVIDHHIVEKGTEFSKNMIVINNQISDFYNNKNLSGAGMAYQFCKALDFVFDKNWADDYIDLAAVGICGDMMSGLEIENQYFWKTGFSNIKNYFLKVLVDKQNFSMGGKINPTTVAFYIVPMINAMIRVGTYEEKERLFLAFIDGHRKVPCNKRGAKGTFEEVAIESARECTNARSRQNKIKDEAVARLEQKIFKHDLLENKILFVRLDESDNFPSTLNGLVAMQLSAKYKKPTIVARLNDEGYVRGSMRGLSNSELESFKEYLDSTGLFEYVQGHENAAGCSILNSDLDRFHKKANEELSKYDFGEKCYDVSFSRLGNSDDLTELILDISKYEDIWSQQNTEPFIYIKNIIVNQSDISVIGKNKDTLKFTYNGVTYIKFHAKDLIDEIQGLNLVEFEIVGRANMNEWLGNYTPQIMIEAYEVYDGELSF